MKKLITHIISRLAGWRKPAAKKPNRVGSARIRERFKERLDQHRQVLSAQDHPLDRRISNVAGVLFGYTLQAYYYVDDSMPRIPDEWYIEQLTKYPDLASKVQAEVIRGVWDTEKEDDHVE